MKKFLHGPFTRLIPATLLLLFSLSLEAASPPTPPNIVVILSDDYGWGSAVCYGADPAVIATPSMDQLAREGMRFTDANTPSSVCTPTRYALLTGRYCWRTYLNHGEVLGTLDPLMIETSRPTIASLLQSQGYQTAFVGKWHLGYGTSAPVDYTAELKPGPLELGFNYQFAVPQNHNDITRVFVENHFVYGLRSRERQPGNKDLGLDAPRRNDPETMSVLTAKAVAWLEQADRRQPFFLCFAPIAVHGLITPSKQTEGTTRAGPYGDFIRDLDLSLGAILDALDRKGVRDNTLLIFTSDNGGVATASDGESAQMIAMKAGLKINGPFRGGKHDVWQGGFQVPMLVRWPGRVPAGSLATGMVGVVDIFATLVEAAGVPSPLPLDAAPDSISFLDMLDGSSEAGSGRRDIILQSSDGVFAIRQGPWKLVEGIPSQRVLQNKNRRREDQFKLMLFNLDNDPGETRDLAADNPKVVRQLSELLHRYRNQGFSRP